MDEECGGDAGKTDAALVPPVNFHVGGVQDVLAEDDGVRPCPTEQDHIAGLYWKVSLKQMRTAS